MAKYEIRRAVNEQSRNSAENYRDPWSATEVELLEENWATAELEAIAELLGRTTEACRQKHYDLAHRQEVQQRAVKHSKWSQGFTNLADMGY